MEFIGQLFLTQLFRPQLLIGSIAHSGGQMVVDFRAALFQFADKRFNILALGMTVVRTGITQRLQVKLPDHVDDFCFAVIQQRPQYGQTCSGQWCDR